MRRFLGFIPLAFLVLLAPIPALAVNKDLFIVAHPDDDLFFMNPDIYNSIQRGDSVEVIFLTSGDILQLDANGQYTNGGPETIDNQPTLWMEREKGSYNAYTRMAIKANKLPGASAWQTAPNAALCAQNTGALALWNVVADPPFTTPTSHTQHTWIHAQLPLGFGQTIDLVRLRITDNERAAANLWLDNTNAITDWTVPATPGLCNEVCTWGPDLNPQDFNTGSCAAAWAPLPNAECKRATVGQANCAFTQNGANGVPAPGSTTVQQQYNRSDLIEVLTHLMTAYAPNRVGAQNSSMMYSAGGLTNTCVSDAEGNPISSWECDNLSHLSAGMFAWAAHQAYASPHSFEIFRGYDINGEAPNLSSSEAADKNEIDSYYVLLDQGDCTDTRTCGVVSLGCAYGNTCNFNGQNPPGFEGCRNATCTANDDPYMINPGYSPWWPSREYGYRDVRGNTSQTGAIAADQVAGGPIMCLSNMAGVVSVVPCEGLLGHVGPSNMWTLDVRGFLTQGGQCLTLAPDNTTLTLAGCPQLPGPTTRWSLFANGQLRGGSNGNCATIDANNSVSLQTCVFNGQQQLWTLQFGSWGPWNFNTDFTDAQIPIGGTDTYFRTFGLTDFNKDGFADACVRRSNGVYCASNNHAGAFNQMALTTQGGWSDANNWGASAYGSTLRYGYPNGLNGDPFVCGRGVLGYYCGDFLLGGLALWTAQFSDGNGWNLSDTYYGSVGLADVNGDGLADVCGRGSAGIWCTLREAPGKFDPVGSVWTTMFSDPSWLPDAYGTSIQFGDINGDGLADVCGRGADGIWCALAARTGGFVNPRIWSDQGAGIFQQVVPGCADALAHSPSPGNYWQCYLPATYVDGDFSDGKGWNTNPAYYRSIRLVDINGDGMADICGRGPDGLVCAYSTGTTFSPARPVLNRLFTDAMGWGVDKYGSSISFGNLAGDKGVGVCGRGTGVYCATIGGQ